MTIRKESAGRFSLDDVVKECWRLYRDEGMPERGLESVARSITGLELEDFFERYVRGTADLPLQGLLKIVGVQLHLRPASDRKDLGGKPAKTDTQATPWLGATLVSDGGASRFSSVLNGSPAEHAGIAPGDEAVAIDGLRLTAENADSRLRDHHVGDTVTLTVFRDHRLLRHRVRLGAPPEDTCYLTIDADAEDDVVAQRNTWLGQD